MFKGGHSKKAYFLFQKKPPWRAPFWNWLGSQAVFIWRHSVRLEIGRKEKNLFLQVIVHFTNLNAIISEFGVYLTQNNIAQEPP